MSRDSKLFILICFKLAIQAKSVDKPIIEDINLGVCDGKEIYMKLDKKV